MQKILWGLLFRVFQILLDIKDFYINLNFSMLFEKKYFFVRLYYE